MSISVAVDDLVATVTDYSWAYLVTVRDDATPHLVAVDPHWSGGAAVMSAGRTSLRNADERGSATLCYPPLEAGGYSLIVDGTAVAGDGTITFTPTGAVLHRPATGASAGSVSGCGSDCAPVPQAGPPRTSP